MRRLVGLHFHGTEKTNTGTSAKWHFPDLEMHVVLVFLYPAQQAWHKGEKRGKRRREFHADEEAQRVAGVLVKIGFDGAVRVEGFICFQCLLQDNTK